MNAPIDPKTVEPVQVTTGSLPGSRKVYAEVPGYAGVKVPFREIALSESSGEPPFRVYDTSGPYSGEAAKIDVNAGPPRASASPGCGARRGALRGPRGEARG